MCEIQEYVSGQLRLREETSNYLPCVRSDVDRKTHTYKEEEECVKLVGKADTFFINEIPVTLVMYESVLRKCENSKTPMETPVIWSELTSVVPNVYYELCLMNQAKHSFLFYITTIDCLMMDFMLYSLPVEIVVTSQSTLFVLGSFRETLDS